MKRIMCVIALLSGALMAQEGRLANGVYAVEESKAMARNPVVRQHEGKDLVLDAEGFVPLVVEGKPEVNRSARGSELTVQLAPDAARRLEDLTRSHFNRPVAVVVGDKILSAPTVRSVITDGKVRVTPCEDKSCETLLRELSK